MYLWHRLTTKRPMIWSMKIWMIECLKMYKISDKIINFPTNPKKNWKVELAVHENPKRHLVITIIAMMVLTYILRKGTNL